MSFKPLYHTNGSGLRTGQKHQLCEDALTNLRAKEAKINRENKKRRLNREKGDCVSVPLSRIKHVAGAETWGILFVLWFSVSVTK